MNRRIAHCSLGLQDFQHSTGNPEPSTGNPDCSLLIWGYRIFNIQPGTLNPKPGTPIANCLLGLQDFQRSTGDPEPSTGNPDCSLLIGATGFSTFNREP